MYGSYLVLSCLVLRCMDLILSCLVMPFVFLLCCSIFRNLSGRVLSSVFASSCKSVVSFFLCHFSCDDLVCCFLPCILYCLLHCILWSCLVLTCLLYCLVLWCSLDDSLVMMKSLMVLTCLLYSVSSCGVHVMVLLWWCSLFFCPVSSFALSGLWSLLLSPCLVSCLSLCLSCVIARLVSCVFSCFFFCVLSCVIMESSECNSPSFLQLPRCP